MKVDGPEVDEGQQRSSVITDDIVRRLLAGLRDVHSLHPVGNSFGELFLIERLAPYSVRPPVHVQGTVLEVGQEPVCSQLVIGQQIRLRVPLLRPVHLSRICYCK